MAKVELKAPIVDEIKGYVSDAKSAVLVDYRGLTVEQDTKLRKQLREAGVVYKVYKNTMLHLRLMEPILRSLTKTWKVLQQSHSVSKMRLLRQELLIILQKKQRLLRLRVEL